MQQERTQGAALADLGPGFACTSELTVPLKLQVMVLLVAKVRMCSPKSCTRTLTRSDIVLGVVRA
jgi:hypothetical protein